MAPVGGSEEDFLNEIITDIENNGNANQLRSSCAAAETKTIHFT